ncbi:O-antigen ligase family protein [Albimonas sp. CAU 1670]|uniref:O-antigen ligase family protein n=1 Tax=Albimonas sp. CAU 1670 TaxID=3032599 RepID=UPI0023D9A812|nr:O-antigen ligase family protein [Albimonas sp. CAU 1670]MDF2235888.1 O-antigen ligase family protein [Albimonas sp. CAU 1670]
MTTTTFEDHRLRATQFVMTVSPLMALLMMTGAVRSVGHIPIYLGYVAALTGLGWIVATSRVSAFLLPSYVLVAWGAASLAFNGLGWFSYVQLSLVLGGIGIAEMAARMSPARIADLVQKRLIWVLLAIIVIEFVMIQMGFGQRQRELDSELSGGLLPDLGIEVPRFMGTMGGSGFSGTMTGALAFLCMVEKRRKAAWILFFMTILMVSRGPFVALVLAAAFHVFRRYSVVRIVAFTVPIVAAAFPLMIWALKESLSPYEVLYLIQVSTFRFLHYMTFLNFGLENPLFGVGYGNYYDNYASVWYTDVVQQWGHFRNQNLIKEAHNFMLDIMGEMGFVGWILAAIQLLMVAWRALWTSYRYGGLFLYVTICFLFLSGLSNWTWWLTVGIVMSHSAALKARGGGAD